MHGHFTLGKGPGRWLGGLVVVALIGALVFVPSPRAAASGTATVAFTGRITLWDDLDDSNGAILATSDPVGMWAPASPACGAAPCPRPTTRSEGQTDWRLDLGSHPLGKDLCVASHSEGGSAAHAGDIDEGAACSVFAWGSFVRGPGTALGPYCGYMAGPVHFTITVGTTTTALSGISVQHAGQQLAWAIPDDDGIGTATMRLVEARGHCGLDPTEGYAPATEFDVVASVSWVPPPPL